MIKKKGDTRLLSIEGLVAEPRAFTSEELARIPTVEATVPGRKGRPDIKGAAFALRDVLDRVKPSPAATHATCISADGLYSASIPLCDLREKGLVLHTPDGPSPWRLVVPEGRTLCWNVKGLISLKLTAGPGDDAVPENPPH